MQANLARGAAVDERHGLGIDPRHVDQAALPLDRDGERSRLLGRFERNLPGATVHDDVDVHRSDSSRARCAQSDSLSVRLKADTTGADGTTGGAGASIA